MTATVPAVAPARPTAPPGHALAGVASIMVHAVALFWMWWNWPARPAEPDTGPRRQIEVRLVPPAAQAARPAPAPDRVPVRIREPARRMLPRSVAAAPAATEHPAMEAPAPAPASAADNTVGPDAAPPAFDMQGALATARQVAREDGKGRKPAFAPDPGARIQDKLEHARRADCRTINAQSMNLLASAFVIAKNVAKNAIDESGCKW